MKGSKRKQWIRRLIRVSPKSRTASEAFGQIYEADAWCGGSGSGSAPDASDPYRRVVNLMVGSCDIGSVVDIGCGDWQVGSRIDWSEVTYVGVDAVPEIVRRNRERYERSNVKFLLADVLADPMPGADLLLAKDVLQHWPLADVNRFLDSHCTRHRYVLLTNDIASVHWAGRVNEDIHLGGWRTLDLEAPPFSRPGVWRLDYQVRGEWTKRLILYASRSAEAEGRWRECNALPRLSSSTTVQEVARG